MNKYFLHGLLKANKDEGDKLSAILLDASRILADAKGCIIYLVSRDIDDHDLIWITEIWDSKEDHDQSLTDPLVKDLISNALPLIAENPAKGQELEFIGGYGI